LTKNVIPKPLYEFILMEEFKCKLVNCFYKALKIEDADIINDIVSDMTDDELTILSKFILFRNEASKIDIYDSEVIH